MYLSGHQPDELPPVYALDSTDVNQWDDHVLKPAVAVVDAFIKVRINRDSDANIYSYKI